MSYKMNTGVDGIELSDASQIDVVNDATKEIMEMIFSNFTCVEEMTSSNAVEVIDILLHLI